MIKQGEIYWMDLGEPEGSEPGYRRPFVVIQNNIFNKSAVRTTVVCGLTSNLKRAQVPGNVLLMPGEGSLKEQSVINVTQVLTVNKDDLTEKIGTLTPERVEDIIDGISLLLKP